MGLLGASTISDYVKEITFQKHLQIWGNRHFPAQTAKVKNADQTIA